MRTSPLRALMRIVVPLVILFVVALIVVILFAKFGPSNHSSSPKAQPTSSVSTPPSASSTQTVAPSATPTPGTSTIELRSINTPAIVIDDMHLSAGQCHTRIIDAAAGLVMPDPNCTPGAIDPAVTQDNIDSTICVSGYTKTVRPPSSVTNKAKANSLRAYGMEYDKTIEYDHFVPLALGGASTTSNLWPQPNKVGATSVNNDKDTVEVTLQRAVCKRTVTLHDAQQAIASDWTTALIRLGLQ